MSTINFCETKEQLNHLGEVVTGKTNGSPSGADIETSALPYTGQVRKTLPALEEEYQSDIDNFVQVSNQVIVDKSSEFDASIANKEAEADSAIDAYRLLSKGPYAAGILLEDKFQYITYNGESYFAKNPPYTTTATTPDADGNLFAGGYLTSQQLSLYTDIVYKASGGNSAVENMTLGIPLSSNVGDFVKCQNGTIFKRTSSDNLISSFEPIGIVYIDDFNLSNQSDCGADFLSMMLNYSSDITYDGSGETYTVNTSIDPNLRTELNGKLITLQNMNLTTTADRTDQLWMFAFGTYAPKRLTLRNFTIDGNSVLQRGIYTHKEIDTDSTVEIKNLWSELSGAIGIHLFHEEVTEKLTCDIVRSKIHTFGGVNTGSVGSAAGSTRAVLIEQPSDETVETTVNIVPDFYDCYGREGDLVQVSAPASLTASNSEVNITDGYLGGSNRRAIKVQGWNVKVKRNTFRTISTSHPEYNRDGQGGAGVLTFGGVTGAVTNTKGHECVGNTFHNLNGIKGSIIFAGGDGFATGNTHKSYGVSVSFFESKFDSVAHAYNNFEIEQYGSGIASINNESSFSGNTVKVLGGSYSLALGFTNDENIAISRNTFEIDSAATSGYLGAVYFQDLSTEFSGVVIERNNVHVPQGTDTRTRCKVAYVTATSGSLGDVTFAYNFLNSDTSPFNEDLDVDYTKCHFVGNGSQISFNDRVLPQHGGNLTSNPRMLTDANGWALNGNASYSADYSGIILQTGSISQSVNVVSGATYMLECKVVDLGNTSFNVNIDGVFARQPFVSRDVSNGVYRTYIDFTGSSGSKLLSILPSNASMAIGDIYLYELD